MFKCVGNVPMGRRVRQRRWMIGMPREELARAIGIQADALKRFETGFGFIEAGHLAAIAEALSMPLSALTAGAHVPGVRAAAGQAAAAAAAESMAFAFPTALG